MDLHHTPIKNEEATPLSSDLKDDTSPPKKRVKHVSDFDSLEQHRVFDLDLDLPALEPGIGDQWRAMFFRTCNPGSAEAFKAIVAKCRRDIEALQVASNKANSYFEKEFALGLSKKKDCPYTSQVLKTIVTGKLVNDYIDTATKMLNSAEVDDVETYLKSVDGIFIESDKAYGLYLEKLEQLAKITNVDKMIKYWRECEGKSYDDMEQLSGLTRMDICCFTYILRREPQINSEIEANQGREKFGLDEINAGLNENMFVESIGKLHPFRDAYLKALAEAEERVMMHEENFGNVDLLAASFERAGVWLRVMRQQMKLLYEKDVIAKGYDKLFFRYWGAAGELDVDDYDD